MKRESLQVASWIDMSHFGVQSLTSESCVFALRILCDVNEQGRLLMIDYLGLPVDTELATPWNSQVSGKPTVGSILLHRDSLKQIAMFAMFRGGALACVVRHGAVIGIFEPSLLTRYEDLLKEYDSTGWELHLSPKRVGPSEGTRNVHALTGRTD